MSIISDILNKFVRTSHPLDGLVTFDEVGFKVEPPSPRGLDWLLIEKIVAYKIDLFSVDEIRVEFQHADGSVVISEESPGFGDFMKEVSRRFPSTAGWYLAVSQPAFAPRLTTLYGKSRT